MQKIFLFFALIVSLGCLAHGKEYIIRYQPRTAGSVYFVETKEGEFVAKVIREKKENTMVYALWSAENALLANGSTVQSDFATHLSLRDQEHKPIGSFSAGIQNLFPIEYQVFSKENNLVAKGTLNWLGSSIVFVDANHPRQYIVTFFRPMFKLFNDHWHFDIHEENKIDLRLLSIIGAFHKSCELNSPVHS